LTCQGYRDTDALRIRDQTRSVSQKTIKRVTNTTLSPPITVSPKDRARAAFFSNYVFRGSKSYDFLGPFYTSVDVDKPLSASLEAVSLAFFAHQENAARVDKEGRNQYASALGEVQKAISCPVAARKDSTLLATMLLDLYEKLTNFNPEFDQAWKSHIKGSLALVEIRGPLLFQDRNGFRMMARLGTNLLISCVATDTPPPPDLAALRQYESKYLNSKDPKWLLSDLMLIYVSLRENISKGQLRDGEIIMSLLSLESEFVNLVVKSPDTWQPQKVRLRSPTERALGDHIDVFLDYHITQTRNVSRLVRILLNEMLRDYASSPAGVGWAYKEGSSLRTRAEKTILKLVNDICASVPQYTCPELTELCSESLSSKSKRVSAGDASSESIVGIRMYSPEEKVRAYTLIFPLYIAGQTVGATEQQKQWIISQLHFMSSAMAIKNAEVVAKILETGEKMNPWKVYALLGSYAFAA
jgi:hypothetical protein